MSSLAAKKVAEEVLENLGKGKKPNLGKIALKKGYKQNTADNPKNITETKSYKEVIDPVVEGLKRFQAKIVAELNSKERLKRLPKEKLIMLSATLKNTTHDIQLLTGGKTENNGIAELAESLNNWIQEAK